MNHIETLRAALDGVMRYLDGDTKLCGHKLDCPCALHAARAALAATAEPAQSPDPVAEWKSHYEEACEAYNYKTKECNDLTAQLAAMTAKYQELIYQVGKKYPGESRHQTALRYLGQAEQDDTDYSVAAIAATKE